MNRPSRAALYLRVSTADQHCENQRPDLETYIAARGWTLTETYIDQGVSGAKDARPALTRLMTDARRRRFDVLLVWRLDRLGRSLRHLLTVIDELHDLGVAFVSLNEGIDLTTAAGRFQFAVLAALGEFERERIRERVRAGLQRAKAHGKRLGRPRKAPARTMVPGGSVREAARAWGVSKSTAARWIATGRHVATV